MELIPRAVADAAWERRARALEAINIAAAVKKKPKKLRRTMSILRHGNFRVKPIGDAHCGIDLGNARIEANYFVRVECVPTLDHRGFLFEQRVVDEVFQGIEECAMSCELLAYTCCQLVKERILNDNPSLEIRCIEVSISAAPFPATLIYVEQLS